MKAVDAHVHGVHLYDFDPSSASVRHSENRNRGKSGAKLIVTSEPKHIASKRTFHFSLVQTHYSLHKFIIGIVTPIRQVGNRLLRNELLSSCQGWSMICSYDFAHINSVHIISKVGRIIMIVEEVG